MISQDSIPRSAASLAAAIVSGSATTDNAAARFDGTAGKLQDSGLIISDTVGVSGITTIANSGIHTNTNATASTSVSTGALVVTGGVGIAGALNIGGVENITVNTAQALLVATSTSASGASAGGFLATACNDGAAMANGDRLGGFFLRGASDGSGTLLNGAGITAFATEAWGASAAGTELRLETTANGGTTRTARLTVGNNGIVTIPAGIIFSNETLSQYDEGTWTPTIFGDGVAGAPTYVNQVGLFTRIGRLVYAVFRVTISAKNTTAGNIGVGGLPFTANATAAASAVFSYMDGATFPAGRTHIGGYQQPSTTYITLYFSGSGVAPARVDAAAVTDALDIIGSVIYGV